MSSTIRRTFQPNGDFAIKASILLAMVAAALAAWTLREVIFIFFGALVLANGMHAVASFLAQRFRIRYAFGLLTVVAPCLTVLGLVAWFFGATINDQLQELANKIPDGVQWLTNEIESRPLIRDLSSKLELNDLSGTTGWLAKTIAPVKLSLIHI